jgi:putative endonuclease
MTFFTYILVSTRSGRYYIGHTESIDRRLSDHNSGKVLSIKNKGPWECIYQESFATKLEANRRELEIKKKKSKIYIENLINNK